MTLMDLVATLKMDISDFRSGAREAKSEAASLKQAIGETGGSFTQTAAEIKQLNDYMMDFAGKAAGVGAALTASVTLPIAELASESLKLASSFQQAEIGFTTLMGSATQAQQFMRELKDFAASTPFEFPDLQRAAGRLQAMGFEAKAVIPIMETVGNATALLGTGEAGINRITLALGQMANSAKVTSQDMNQLVQANIGAWQYLSEAVGKSVSETKDMVKNGLISGTEGVVAILEGMNQKFAGGMQGQMQTLAGQWSNLKDQISFILADIGKALTPFAQTVINAAAPVLDFIKNMTEGFKNLPEGMQGAIVALAGLAAAIGPAMLAFAGFTATVSTLGSLLGVSGLAGIISMLSPILVPLAVAILAAGVAWEAWKIEPVREAITSVWNTLQDFWTTTLKPIVETVGAAALAFVNFAGSLISSGLQAYWEGLQAIGSTLMEAVTSLVAALAPLWDAFKNVLDSLSPLMQPIEELLEFLGRMVVALVEAGLIVAWEALKTVFGLVSESVSILANLIGGSLITLLNGLANMVREVSGIWDALFKPAIQGAIDAVRSFLGALAQIPGVKQAIDGVNALFNGMKEKVVSAVDGARESVRAWGEDTRTSMTKAKEALDSAQKAYTDVTEKAKEGKATEAEITKVTNDLARAKADYRAELERVKPRQEELTRAVKDARTEYDAAEQNLRKVQKAFDDGKASAGDLASAQTRVNDASVALKKSQSDLSDITKQTGQAIKEYGGGIDTVRDSLRSNNEHTQTAKELQAALKAEVDQAKQAFVKAFEAYRNGTADVASVQAAFENLQAAQDRQHPEKAAEAFVKARQAEKEAAEKNLEWYENTYLPKWAQMGDQLQAQELKLQETFFKAHEAIKQSALSIVPVVKGVFDNIAELESMDPGVLAAIENNKRLQEAYKDLGVQSSAAIINHADVAKAQYERILNSGTATAYEILQAERAALKAQIEAHVAAGEEITSEERKRLKDLDEALSTSLKGQKTLWDEFSKDVIGIANRLNNDISHAFIDLFEGKGWKSFKEAGVAALEEIGASVIRIGIEYIEGILIRKLKDIFMENGILDGLMEAFKKFGSYVIDLFKEIGSTIVDGIKAAVGWITNAVGGGASAAGGAAGAAGGAAGSAGSTAGSAGSVASGIASGVSGVVTAVASVASAVTGVIGVIQGMHQSADLGRIEENTRFTQIGIVGNGGLVQMADVYWPKLEGIEQFNYNVLAPIMSDISDNLIGKLDRVYAALVVDVKNEIIDVKNQFHDLLFSNLDNGETLSNMYLALGSISGSLDEIKMVLSGIGQNTQQSAFADSQIASSTTQQMSSLMTIGNNIMTLGPTITSAISNLDIRGSLSSAMNSISSQFSTLSSSIDIRSTLQSGFNMLGSQLVGMSNSLSSAFSNTRMNTPSTNVYMTVNGSTAATNTSNLAAILRSYGVVI